MLGQPVAPGMIWIVSMRRRRPLALTFSLRTDTKCSRRLNRLVSPKYEPSKLSVNGRADTPVLPIGTRPGALASVFVGTLLGVDAAVAPAAEPVPTSTVLKSTLDLPDAESSCTSSERTSSSAGTALPTLAKRA